jgi:hypothetical protein
MTFELTTQAIGRIGRYLPPLEIFYDLLTGRLSTMEQPYTLPLAMGGAFVMPLDDGNLRSRSASTGYGPGSKDPLYLAWCSPKI